MPCPATVVKPVQRKPTATPATQAGVPFDVYSEYRINPGDLLNVSHRIGTCTEQKQFRLTVGHVLEVQFPGIQALKPVEEPIRPDGKITLPYLGDVHVAGLAADELNEMLNERYKDHLRDPQVFAMVADYRTANIELSTELRGAATGASAPLLVRPDGRVTFPPAGRRARGGTHPACDHGGARPQVREHQPADPM